MSKEKWVCHKRVTCFGCGTELKECEAFKVLWELEEERINEDGVAWISEIPIFEREGKNFYNVEIWVCYNCRGKFEETN